MGFTLINLLFGVFCMKKQPMEPVRKVAKDRGETKYLSSRPCPNNHPMPVRRQVRNGSCCRCDVDRSLKWRAKKRGQRVLRHKPSLPMEVVIVKMGPTTILPPYEPSVRERIDNLRF